MKCVEIFEKTYKKAPEDIAFCPYRICPIGAHVDHNLGKITGFAIDKGISIAYATKQNGIIELMSLNFEKRAQWHINSTPSVKQNDWADYLRGTVIALQKRYKLQYGICGVIEGSMPIGGLSSSASVILSFLSAVAKVNGIKLGKQEAIDIAYEAERFYVGVSVGKLDQSCEVLCEKDSLLFLDNLDNSYEIIKKPDNMKPFEIAIFFSGLDRNLAGSKYNMRVDELRSAAYALMAYVGMDYGKFEETNMRSVKRDVYETYKTRLPENWAKRAEHWFTEVERAEKAAFAWKNGDIEEFGKLSFESGWSSIHNWESGALEQIKLYEIMRDTEGIYGGRFSGAGFKGCCMAIINPDYRESIIEKVTREYLKAYPHLEGKYAPFICNTADGIVL